jgi:transposase
VTDAQEKQRQRELAHAAMLKARAVADKEAFALKLIAEGLSHTLIAKRVGKSLSWVSRLARRGDK